MGKQRKEEVEEEEVAPFWMISFSDLMTLLMSFFIILFSMSTLEVKKVEEVMESMRGRFIRGHGNKDPRADPNLPRTKTPPGGETPSSASAAQADAKSEEQPAAKPTPSESETQPANAKTDTPEDHTAGQQQQAQPADAMQESPPVKGQTANEPHSPKSGTVIPFALEVTELSADDQKVLAQLAEELQSSSHRILIRGHASNKEQNHRVIDDLAYERAWNVRDFLLSHGLDRKRFLLVVVGPNEPLPDTLLSPHFGDANTYVDVVQEN